MAEILRYFHRLFSCASIERDYAYLIDESLLFRDRLAICLRSIPSSMPRILLMINYIFTVTEHSLHSRC